MEQPELETRLLRNDLAEVCAAQRDRLDLLAGADADQLEALEAMISRLDAIDGHLVAVLESSEAIDTDLNHEAGLPVRLASQAGPVDVEAPSGIPVSNPGEVSGGVEAAAVQTSETVNSTAWAIFGMVVGFGLLVWLFRMVRP